MFSWDFDFTDKLAFAVQNACALYSDLAYAYSYRWSLRFRGCPRTRVRWIGSERAMGCGKYWRINTHIETRDWSRESVIKYVGVDYLGRLL